MTLVSEVNALDDLYTVDVAADYKHAYDEAKTLLRNNEGLIKSMEKLPQKDQGVLDAIDLEVIAKLHRKVQKFMKQTQELIPQAKEYYQLGLEALTQLQNCS